MHHNQLAWDKQENRRVRAGEHSNNTFYCELSNILRHPRRFIWKCVLLSQQPYPELHVHKINDRHHHPSSNPPWHLVAQAHTSLVWGTLADVYEWKTALALSTVQHTQAKCVHREMRRLNKLPSLVQFVISCVLCAAQGAVAAIYPADIFFLPLVRC